MARRPTLEFLRTESGAGLILAAAAAAAVAAANSPLAGDYFAFLAERMGDLPVGKLRSGETVVDFTVGIPGTALASHVGIFATTGRSIFVSSATSGAVSAE